jgi:DNA (cytosine-5)-methyltransferase 1
MVARLQGWQDDWGWRFSGRKTARYRQIGNAFPPPVAQTLGSAIRSALEHAGTPGAGAAGDADSPDGAHVHDPVFRVLRSRADFLTARQIAQLAAGLSAGAGLSQTAVLGRLRHLGQDFELEVADSGSGDPSRGAPGERVTPRSCPHAVDNNGITSEPRRMYPSRPAQ